MANEDILLSVGLDLSDFEKDMVALKAKAVELRNQFAKMPAAEIKARFGVNTKKQLLDQFTGVIKEVDAKLKQDAGYQLVVGGVKADKKAADNAIKEAQRIAKGQEDAAKRGLDIERRAEENARKTSQARVTNEINAEKKIAAANAKAAADREALRAREDRYYNDYLSKQTAGIEKQKARQDRIFNDYMAKEQAALAKHVTKTQALMSRLESPAVRYALYDISRNFAVMGIAATAAGVAVTAMAAKQESAMSDLERTTLAGSRSVELLKFQFQELAQQIPLSFADLTSIGAIGAQMGIASSELAGFTKTVAQFAATTNVSIDSAAQSFGTIGELLGVSAEDYKKLGSSIALVGVRSNATESQILAVTTGIAGVAAQANVSTEYVIGLAGTLASLGVPAEQARGALTRIFQQVNRSAAEGGQSLADFASIVGMSATDLQALLSSEGGMEKFFSKFTQGLSGLDAQQLTTTLDALGLADVRVTNVLARLSENTAFMAENMSNANEGFENGTILAQLFANKAEDLATKFQTLLNSFTQLGAAVGEALLPVIGPLIDWLSTSVRLLADFASTDTGKVFITIAAAIAVLVGSFGFLASSVTLAGAAVSAFAFALDALGIQGGAAALGKMALAFIGVGTGASAGAIAMNVFKIALAGTGIGLAVVALGALASAFMNASLSADQAFKNMISDTSGLAAALKADEQAYTEARAAGNQQLMDSFVEMNLASEIAKNEIDGFSDSTLNMYDALGEIPPALDDVKNGFEDATVYIGDATRKWITDSYMASQEFQDLFKSADFTKFVKGTGLRLDDLIDMAAAGATEQDLINELARLQAIAVANKIDIPIVVSTTALGVNYIPALAAGGQEASKFIKSLTGIGGASYLAATATDSLANSAVEAEPEIKGLGNSAGAAAEKVRLLTDYANDLSSVWDRARDIRFSGAETLDNVTQAFLNIADATEKARIQIQEITMDIQSLNADIQSLTADRALQEYFLTVAEAYGDSLKAAEIRANLAKIDADLVKKNADLAKKTTDLGKAQDKTNKTLVGSSDAAIENRAEILDLVKGYQEHINALAASGVKEEELKAKASQLKSEFIAQATQLGYNVDELGYYAVAFDDVKAAIDAVPRDVTVDFNGDPALTAINEFVAKANDALSGVGSGMADAYNEQLAKAARGDVIKAEISRLQSKIVGDRSEAAYGPRMRELSNILQSGNYADGGYTGAGGKYDVAGIVHKGEYVVPKSQVNQVTGLPYFMSQPRSFAQGGFTGAANGGMVSLSPEDRALLRNVGGSGNIVLYADSKELARSVNDGNRQIVASGGRP